MHEEKVKQAQEKTAIGRHAFIRISEISEEDKVKFLPLLLLGDESEAMIKRYIHRGRLFALYEHNDAASDLRAVCVLTNEGDGLFEIKNLAVAPEHQRCGFGRRMVFFVVDLCRQAGAKTLFVGTGRDSQVVSFYEKCGFAKSHIVDGFFEANYDHPIIEDGICLKDMQYLRIDF